MKKILVTAGPTYEPIDPVRFIGNRSSGKQGISIAKAFADKGYEVNLVVGPVNESLLENLNPNIKVYRVNTAQEMLDTSLKYIDCYAAIHTAAVSDYRPKTIYDFKIKKGGPISFNDIEFIENADILSTFGHSEKRPKIVIGFAAETNNLLDNAKAKLSKKNADFIILNDVSNGKVFGKDTNKVYIVSKNSIKEYKEMNKYDIGKELVRIVEEF